MCLSQTKTGIIEYVNPSFEKLTGYTREAAIGQSPRILSSGHHGKGFYESLWKAILSGEVFRAEFVNKKKCGKFYYEAKTITPVKDRQGNITHFVSTGKDITERKRAEEALQESEERFRRLASAAFEGIAIHDGREILDANQTLAEMFGYDWAELIGKNLPELAAPEWKDVILKSILSGSEKPYEAFDMRKDGSTFPGELVGKPIPYQGRMVRVTVIRDITERKRAEAELSKHRDHLDELVQERTLALNAVNKRLQQEITERKRAEALLKAWAQQQAVVAKLGQHALSETDLSALMDNAVAALAQTLEVEYCKILELLPDGDAFLMKAGVGWSEGLVGHATVESGTGSQAGYTLLCNEPVIVENLRTERRFSGPRLLHDHGVVSGMSVIIGGQERPFGILGVHTIRRRTFTKDSVHFLQAVANLLAEAIDRKLAEEELRTSREQMRELARHLQAAREKERNRIAREVHDELGQALAVLKMDLAWLSTRLSRHHTLLEKIASTSKLLERVINSVQRISSELRSDLLDHLGLSAAIDWQVNEFQDRMGITCDPNLEVDDALPDQDLSIATFRILQEALLNVARHAEATKVTVSMTRQGDQLALIVRDNGKGITKQQISDPKSFGLIGMRERAHACNGVVSIMGLEGKGTTVAVCIPLPER